MNTYSAKVIMTLAAVVAALSHPVLSLASGLLCAFNTTEHFGDYSFSVSSRPDGECMHQSLSIAVQKNAKLVALFDKSSDKLVEKAWVDDLDDDGRPELILVGHIPANPAVTALSVYALDGAGVKEIALPGLTDKEGYRGSDQFSRDGGKIVRSYPLYRNGDLDGAPTGGKRVVSYMYRNRQLLPGNHRDLSAKETVAVKSPKNVKRKGKGERAPAVRITGIAVKADYLEILADGAIEKYKVTRIADPWRLIIDIADATSALPANSVAINGLGISNARFGNHKGHLRIVLDSTENSLPTETVTPAEHALRIGFYRESR